MYVIPVANDGCRQPRGCTASYDRTMLVGINTFHVWGNAYHTAVWANRQVGEKRHKIVVSRGHWLVVDNTWERNT